MSLSESPQLLPNLDISLAVSAKDENSPKAREREERFRLARERQREEQRRRLEELRESMERAEEFRRKQEEIRRLKIEEMKRRDEQHRASVEERRKKLLDEENERKQAILRKTEAKLEQTKQKKTSGPSVALFSSYSGSLNVTHATPLGASDFRSVRNLESTLYENNVPIARRKTTLIVRRKRLSSSVDQIARIRATISENQPSKQEVGPSSTGSVGNGSPSPSMNNRAKSMGSIRKSRADVRKTTESSQPVVNGRVTPTEQTRNLASTRTGISKSVSSSEALGLNITTKSTTKSPAFPRPSVLTAKFAKGPPMIGTPPAKLPLSPPKTMTPKSLPKPLKDTSSQRSLTSNKGSVKAVHDLPIQIQPLQLEKKKDLAVSDANERQTDVSANGEPSSVETSDKTSKISVEEEYKVKLTEKRRLAREKAEREAEEERLRVEDERRKEEERLRIEEEEQRKHEEEVEEARKREDERFRLAVEEAERQRKEEDEKQETERQEKLAAEMKAQEEVEKRDKEREEKFRREEEERQERKKRIEMIMKRVKTDDSSQKDLKELKATEPAGGDDSGMKFVSPLLRQLMGSKLKGKVTGAGSPSATPESCNDDSKTLKIEASSVSTDVMKANLDELLDEKSETPATPSLDLQSQLNMEETVNRDSETINEAESSLCTLISTNSDEEGGTDSCSPTLISLSNEEAVSDATQSNLEVINLSSYDNKVTKASDNNQNWSKQSPDASTTITEQSLPDLPRIAFDESTVKNSQNKLPDILL